MERCFEYEELPGRQGRGRTGDVRQTGGGCRSALTASIFKSIICQCNYLEGSIRVIRVDLE